MKRKRLVLLAAGVVLITAVLILALKSRSGEVRFPPPTLQEAALAEGNNEFALDLYANLRETEGNLFLSPYSIRNAAAMAYAGARGQTATEIEEVLHFDPEGGGLHAALANLAADLRESGGNYRLSIANALWVQKNYALLPEFTQLVTSNYGAAPRQVDFISAPVKAAGEINDWVSNETAGKIKNLVPPDSLNDMTRLVLTNAIYFKGQWAKQFKKDRTFGAKFALLDGSEVDVQMMNQGGDYRFFEDDMLQVLELPYKGERLSMVIFLPRQAAGLPYCESIFTYEKLSELLSRMRKREEVDVSLPKFAFTSEFRLEKTLAEMGMQDAFSMDAADFSGMTKEDPLFISAALHKAFVEVNEEGTEAAAATGVHMTPMAAGRPFRADHPFLFVIRDRKTGAILFIGRVVDPTQEF